MSSNFWFKELMVLLISLLFCYVGHKIGYEILLLFLLVRMWVEQMLGDD